MDMGMMGMPPDMQTGIFGPGGEPFTGAPGMGMGIDPMGGMGMDSFMMDAMGDMGMDMGMMNMCMGRSGGMRRRRSGR